jgi:hypothetical protein
MAGDAMSSSYGELSQALMVLLKYLEHKGQIPNLQDFIVINVLEGLINNYTNIRIHINWDKLVELSINAPRESLPPLWLEALERLARISAQTQIITELNQRKKLERVIP